MSSSGFNFKRSKGMAGEGGVQMKHPEEGEGKS